MEDMIRDLLKNIFTPKVILMILGTLVGLWVLSDFIGALLAGYVTG